MIRPNEEQLQHMLANSYKNFHAKGVDYLCLSRTDELTRKVYFMDGDVSKLSDVVNPHDHRYDFDTVVLAGKMSNSYYAECDADYSGAEPYQQFSWDTPLNGGNGFTWNKETHLYEYERFARGAGERYFMPVDLLHTIRMEADQTVILVRQHEDIVPVGVPTRTFVSERKAPSLDGLYERMDIDHLLKRLAQVAELMGDTSHD